jgi:6-phosphogluconate dehydrogenase
MDPKKLFNFKIMMKKEIGIVGLGRMGLNMTFNLLDNEYRVVGYDRSADPLTKAAAYGAETATSISALVGALSAPRVVWLMVSSSVVAEVVSELELILDVGDTIIDGGNSFYKDSLLRHKELAKKGIHFLDVGTSGGVKGARHGASIMVGGEPSVFAKHEHIFSALAAPAGYARVGNAGAGHFVKMIHNGIEYGMMGAIAEGMTILHEHEEMFGIDLKEVFKPYEHESIITSKLVSWLREAYEEGQIEAIKGEVPQGETEFEMEHITTLGDVKVLEAALAQRKQTRVSESYLGKLVAAMRNQFGGHKVLGKE